MHHRWWFLWNFELYSITFDEDQKETKQFKIVNDVLFHSLQSALTSVVKHRNVNSFILHRIWWFVWLWCTCYNDERSRYGKSQYHVKDEKHLKTEKRFNRLLFISILCKHLSIMSRSSKTDSLFQEIWWVSINDFTNVETRSRSCFP